MKTFLAAGVGVLLLGGARAGSQEAPSAVEAKMAATVDAATPWAVELLQKIVDINSGTMNFAGRGAGEGCAGAAA